MNEYLATVRFDESGRKYTYRTYLSDLIPGDIVIVDTARGLTKGIFVEYIDETDIQLLKLILAKVDPETWEDYRGRLEED